MNISKLDYIAHLCLTTLKSGSVCDRIRSETTDM